MLQLSILCLLVVSYYKINKFQPKKIIYQVNLQTMTTIKRVKDTLHNENITHTS